MKNLHQITVIGVPLDLGAGRRGTNMGPTALRLAGLEDALRERSGSFAQNDDIAIKIPEVMEIDDQTMRYLPEIKKCVELLFHKVRDTLEERRFPLILGGDHSIAIGSIAGVASHYRQQAKKIGVLWVDAHADFNTPESSPSGNIHGMPLAISVGLGPKELVGIGGTSRNADPDSVVLLALRDVDEGELLNIRSKGIKVFTMRDIDEIGIKRVMDQCLEIVCADTAGFHVSFDADSIDPSIAPGVGTPVNGGLTYREAHLIMEMIYDCGKALSLEYVETNPILDVQNRTAKLGVELISSFFGKSISHRK